MRRINLDARPQAVQGFSLSDGGSHAEVKRVLENSDLFNSRSHVVCLAHERRPEDMPRRDRGLVTPGHALARPVADCSVQEGRDEGSRTNWFSAIYPSGRNAADGMEQLGFVRFDNQRRGV